VNGGTIHDETVWSINNYKIGYKTTQLIFRKELKYYDDMVSKKIERLKGVENVHKFLKGIQNKEFQLLPFRVSGDEDEIKAHLLMRNDLIHHSFTLYNKLAFITLFIFEMVDTRVQEEPFVQIALERFYSKKKGQGSKVLKHLIQHAKRSDVTLTAWCENKRLSEYFTTHGFVEQYKSLTTGHYFLKLN
jgi:hypothetical protein